MALTSTSPKSRSLDMSHTLTRFFPDPKSSLVASPKLSSSPSRPSTAAATSTSTTAPLTTFTTKTKSCYLCNEQNPGDFSPTTHYLSNCLLCSRDFCPIHRSLHHNRVCSTNHSKYHHDQLENLRHSIANQYSSHGPRDRIADESEAEEILTSQGIFPSLGERKKLMWSSTPVSDEKTKEIETLRTLDARVQGTLGRTHSSLIETRDFVGADIAV